ncbi:MAG: MBL fold metallo-hydrolase [Fidelibacterota bacterium]
MYWYLLQTIFLFTVGNNLLQARTEPDELLSPQSISYEGVTGYTDQDTDPCLEWGHTTEGTKIPVSLNPPSGLRIRWLGTAGYEISDDSVTILIDPFVSRPKPYELFRELDIDTEAVDYYILEPLQVNQLQLILISHNHYDHVLDLPYILSRFPDPETRPLVVGDPNVAELLHSFTDTVSISWLRVSGGLENTRIVVADFYTKEPTGVTNHSKYVGHFGDFEIWAYSSLHPAYHPLPWRGPEGQTETSPPFTALGYKTYHNISIEYLISYKGLRIYFSETPITLYPKAVEHAHIVLQGIAARKNEHTIPQTLAYLKPQYLIPAHYDNFFKPLQEFQQFDYHIGLPYAEEVIDFSRWEEFLVEFPTFLKEAQGLNPQATSDNPTQIRVLKLFYYYSLESLIPQKKE